MKKLIFPLSQPTPSIANRETKARDGFAHVRIILEDVVRDRAFPGASVCVTYEHEVVWQMVVGNFTYEAESPAVTPETAFDLASLTKVIATTTMAMLLYERRQLALDQPVADLVPEFTSSHNDHRRQQVTLRMLMAHSSGLPAYIRLFESCGTRQQLLQAAFAASLEADPMARAEYSDIGFIILGEAMERLAGESMDTFCLREIFTPLGMKDTRYSPSPELKGKIPPTLHDKDFRRRVVQGEVNDENASVMGGIAGHAGLFAPADDIARFSECMLRGGAPIIQPETVAMFTKRQTTPAGTTHALGWDTPSTPSQSGKHFSNISFGHLGYTGTSVWIDPVRHLSITLLTNRTWPDGGSQMIKQVRPALHDAIIEELPL